MIHLNDFQSYKIDVPADDRERYEKKQKPVCSYEKWLYEHYSPQNLDALQQNIIQKVVKLTELRNNKMELQHDKSEPGYSPYQKVIVAICLSMNFDEIHLMKKRLVIRKLQQLMNRGYDNISRYLQTSDFWQFSWIDKFDPHLQKNPSKRSKPLPHHWNLQSIERNSEQDSQKEDQQNRGPHMKENTQKFFKKVMDRHHERIKMKRGLRDQCAETKENMKKRIYKRNLRQLKEYKEEKAMKTADDLKTLQAIMKIIEQMRK